MWNTVQIPFCTEWTVAGIPPAIRIMLDNWIEERDVRKGQSGVPPVIPADSTARSINCVSSFLQVLMRSCKSVVKLSADASVLKVISDSSFDNDEVTLSLFDGWSLIIIKLNYSSAKFFWITKTYFNWNLFDGIFMRIHFLDISSSRTTDMHVIIRFTSTV